MKIFVIHSGADYATVKSHLIRLSQDTSSTEILMLKNGGKFWKIEAAKKISQAQLVLFFVGKNSYNSRNIAWEIKQAFKHRKPIITIKLDPSSILHPALKQKNKYTKEEYWINENMPLVDVVKRINDYSSGEYSLFNGDIEEKGRQEFLLEQYKLFLQTSESLVARRQSVNNFYISVNSALITLLNVFIALNLENTWKRIALLAIPAVGIILCYAWIKLLYSYGELNASKMRVISIIEKHLPASLYDAEWRIQSDQLNKRPYVSFTKREAMIPKIFIVLYSLVLIASIAFLVITVLNF